MAHLFSSSLFLWYLVLPQDKSGDFRASPHPFRWAVAHNSTVLFDHESEALVLDMLTIDDPLLRSYYLSDVQVRPSAYEPSRDVLAQTPTAPRGRCLTHQAMAWPPAVARPHAKPTRLSPPRRPSPAASTTGACWCGRPRAARLPISFTPRTTPSPPRTSPRTTGWWWWARRYDTGRTAAVARVR
jgi:hypothetical protein